MGIERRHHEAEWRATHESIARLAWLIWQYTLDDRCGRTADKDWFEAEHLLQIGVVAEDDPDPITTLIEAEWPI
jgi:hypothetical protein